MIYFSFLGWCLWVIYNQEIFEKLRPLPWILKILKFILGFFLTPRFLFYLLDIICFMGAFKNKGEKNGIFHQGSGPTHPDSLMEKNEPQKTWSKNALDHLKWILKSTCFFTFMRPTSPLLVSPSRQSRGWVMGWIRRGHNGKKTSLL